MANLQYIGARYVPEIFTNPDDQSADWKAGLTYEALTIVTYNNDSYTSKKAVPNNIGDPASNPDYWVKTGNFNASLTALQNIVSANTLDIAALFTGKYLNNRKVVIYGDSTVALTPSYMTMACTAAGAASVVNRAVSATRMATGPNNGVALINASTDLTDFDYIFICYGTNEWQEHNTEDGIINACYSIISAIRSKNSNIKIIFNLPWFSYRTWGNGLVNYSGLTLEDTIIAIEKYLSSISIPYIDFFHRSSCNAYNYTYLLEDSGGIYVHATDNFKKEIASIVLAGPDTNLDFNIHKYNNIFNAGDFSDAQRKIVAADFNANPTTGLLLKLDPGDTTYSAYKLLHPSEKYWIVGKSSAAATITIGSLTYNVSGNFKIHIPSITYNNYSIAISSTTGCIISNLNMYEDTYNSDGSFNLLREGRMIYMNIDAAVSGNLTVWNSYPPRYAYQPNGIVFDTATFQLASSVAADTKLLDLDSKFDCGWFYLTCYRRATVDGIDMYIPYRLNKMAGDNTLKASIAMPAGEYVIDRQLIPYVLNSSLYNSPNV